MPRDELILMKMISGNRFRWIGTRFSVNWILVKPVTFRCLLSSTISSESGTASPSTSWPSWGSGRRWRLHLRQFQLQRLLRFTHPVLDSALDGRQYSGCSGCCWKIKSQLNPVFPRLKWCLLRKRYISFWVLANLFASRWSGVPFE